MTARYIFAFILILLGLSVLFNMNFWRILWPVLLIWIGLMLLFGGFSNTNSGKGYIPAEMETTSERTLDLSVVFSPLNKKVVTDDFTGGKVDAVFGGGELDLRDAKIKKGGTARLEVNAVFGGMKIIVPEDWRVESNLTAVFGGFTNKTKTPAGKEQGTLVLKGSAVFGGGEVTN